MKETNSNGGIRVRAAGSCPGCGGAGEVFYRDLVDRLFGAAGEWNLRRCRSKNCGTLWLDPKPDDQDIPKLYASYYTHDLPAETDELLGGSGAKLAARRAILGGTYGYVDQYPTERPGIVARLLARSRAQQVRVGRIILWLKARPGGRVLDFGCGSGKLLRRLATLGWEAVGYEPDPEAARVASEQLRIPVGHGDLGQFLRSQAPFDAVTMVHVIEHVSTPAEVLSTLRESLKETGILVMVTPNAKSLGHRLFGKGWRGLEPPRHLQIFSPHALARCARDAGFPLVDTFTTAVAAPYFWQHSRPSGSVLGRIGWPSRMSGRAFEALEQALLPVYAGGEELVAVCRTRRTGRCTFPAIC